MHISPSSEQLRILDSRASTLMIEARAGTGKTTTLSMLAANAPGVVLGLCFSEGARKRFYEKLEQECSGKKVQVLTVEVLARSQLTRIAEHGKYLELPERIATPEQLRPHLIEAANSVWRRYEGRDTEFDFNFEHRGERVEQMLRLLATLKATLASLRFDDDDFEDFGLDEVAEHFGEYREAIEICREFERRRQPQDGHYLWQSPADYAADLVAVLRQFPEAVHDMPHADLILVDEWHDVNAAEFELLNLFRRNARLVVVGDRYQIINAERGADPRFSESAFDARFAGAERLPLSQSRRCGTSVKRVLDLALPKSGFESHPETYSEVRKVQYDAAAPDACAIAVATQAKELITSKQCKPRDIAIIVREADQTVEIENQLLDAGVPYACDGTLTYLLRPEVMMLRALLHIACGDYSSLIGDRDSCERMVESLLVYLAISADPEDYDAKANVYGDEDPVKQQKEHVVQHPETLAFLFSGLLCEPQPYDSPTGLRWKGRFKQTVEALKERAASSTTAELVDFAIKALDLPAATRTAFVGRARADSAVRTISAFQSFVARHGNHASSAFLHELRRRQDKAGGGRSAKAGGAQVTLATVQAAKGREWRVVLLPYLEKGQFPRRTHNPEDAAEERRYLYVAISRVISQLYLFEPDAAHSELRSLAPAA